MTSLDLLLPEPEPEPEPEPSHRLPILRVRAGRSCICSRLSPTPPRRSTQVLLFICPNRGLV